MSTPWGQSQRIYKKGHGVAFASCAGHGGFRVSKALAEKRMPASHLKHSIYLNGYYWFEEDCAWAFVALNFPEYFQDMPDVAIRTLNHWYPEVVAA